MLAQTTRRLQTQSSTAPAAAIETTLLPFLYSTKTIQQRKNYSKTRSHKSKFGKGYVPFENKKHTSKSRYDFSIEDTTITPSERNAFKKLFALPSASTGRSTTNSPGMAASLQSPLPSESEPKSASAGTQSQNHLDQADPTDELDSIFAKALARSQAPPYHNNFSAPLQGLASAAEEQRARAEYEKLHQQRLQHERDARGSALNSAIDADITDLQTRLDATVSDADVWEVMQGVLRRVRELGLDGADSPRSAWGKSKRGKKSTAPVSGGSGTSAKPTDLQILTVSLPAHLLNIQRCLDTDYRGSSLRLAVLPTIRDLGPTAFAMGASTALYDSHMWALHGIYPTNLGPILEMLAEMEREAYAFSERTHALLLDILAKSKNAFEEKSGVVMQMLYSTERLSREVEEVAQWLRLVERKREEEALRISRAAEAAAEREMIESQKRGRLSGNGDGVKMSAEGLVEV